MFGCQASLRLGLAVILSVSTSEAIVTAQAEPPINSKGPPDSSEWTDSEAPKAAANTSTLSVKYEMPGAEAETRIFVERIDPTFQEKHGRRNEYGQDEYGGIRFSRLKNGESLTLNDLPAGNYRVARYRLVDIVREGTGKAQRSVYLDRQWIELAEYQTKSIALSRPTGHSISGRVIHPVDLKINMLVVHVCSENAGSSGSLNHRDVMHFDALNADADGRFKTESLPPGRYKVLVEGYANHSLAISGEIVPSWQGTGQVEVCEANEPAAIEVTLRAFDRNAWLKDESLTTNEFELLKPYPKLQTISLDRTGPQFLEIVKEQRLPWHALIFIEDGKCSGIQRVQGLGPLLFTSSVDEEPWHPLTFTEAQEEDHGSLDVRPSGEIIGRLIDAVSAEPVVGASIPCGAIINDSLLGGGAVAVTDTQGRYRLRVPSPGIYNVWLKKFDQGETMTAAADDGLLVEAGKITASQLSLVKGRKVTGKVVDTNGRPFPNLSVNCHSTALPQWGGIQSVQSMDDGSFEFALPPGRAYLYVNECVGKANVNPLGRGGFADAHFVVSAAEEVTPITLRIHHVEARFGDTAWLKRSTPGTQIIRHENSADVRGTVVDSDGKPIVGAKVFREDGPINISDKTGKFTVTLDKGTQVVMHAFASGYHVWFGTPTAGDVLKIVMEKK